MRRFWTLFSDGRSAMEIHHVLTLLPPAMAHP
jgi:hypothetical protein